MVLLYALVVSLLIVAGQACWKHAVVELGKTPVNILSVEGALKLVTSFSLIAGVVLYCIATLAYILLLSKYKYFQVQSIVVGSSLVFTLLLSATVFHEQTSVVNLVGVGLILTGALLIIK